MAGLRSEISVSKQSIKEITDALRAANEAREAVQKAGANAKKAISNATTRATNAINAATSNLEKSLSSVAKVTSATESSQRALVSESKAFLNTQTETKRTVARTRKEMDAMYNTVRKMNGLAPAHKHWRVDALAGQPSMMGSNAAHLMYANAMVGGAGKDSLTPKIAPTMHSDSRIQGNPFLHAMATNPMMMATGHEGFRSDAALWSHTQLPDRYLFDKVGENRAIKELQLAQQRESIRQMYSGRPLASLARSEFIAQDSATAERLHKELMVKQAQRNLPQGRLIGELRDRRWQHLMEPHRPLASLARSEFIAQDSAKAERLHDELMARQRSLHADRNAVLRGRLDNARNLQYSHTSAFGTSAAQGAPDPYAYSSGSSLRMRAALKVGQLKQSAMSPIADVKGFASNWAKYNEPIAKEFGNKFAHFSLEGFGKSFSRQMSRFTTMMLPIAIATQIGRSIFQAGKQVVDFADKIMWANTKLHTLNDGSRTTLELQNDIADAAVRMRMDYVNAADTVRLMASSTSDLLDTNDQHIEFSELFNKTLMISGTTGQAERLSAIGELTKNLARGKTTPYGFARLVQDNYRLIELMAEDQGLPVKEILEMGVKGKVTTAMMMSTLVKHRKEIDDEYQKLPKTFTDYVNKLKAEVAKAYLPLSGVVSDFLNRSAMVGQSALSKIADFVFKAIEKTIKALISFATFVSNNWDHIVFGFKILSAAVAAYLSGHLTMLIAQTMAWMSLQIASAAVAVWGWIKVAAASALANWQLWATLAAITAVYIMWKSGNEVLKLVAIAVGTVTGAFIAYKLALMAVTLWQTRAIGAHLLASGLLVIALAAAYVAYELYKLYETDADFRLWVNSLAAQSMRLWAYISHGWLWMTSMIKIHMSDLSTTVRNMMTELAANVVDPVGGIVTRIGDQISNITGNNKFRDVTEKFTVKGFISRTFRSDKLDLEKAKKTAELSASLNEELDFNATWAANEQLDHINRMMQKKPGEEGFNLLKRMQDALKLVQERLGIIAKEDGTKGKIRGKVSLEKEDLKLLKEIAQSEYINKITKLTPNLQVTFGDIRETADMNVIMDTIADMVETSYANTLVF